MRRAVDGREADAVQLSLCRADAGGDLPDGLDVAVVELLLEARAALERDCDVSGSRPQRRTEQAQTVELRQ